MPWVLRAAALGAAAGFVGGLFGIGGGLVMIPVMVLFMGIPQHRAHAVSIAVVVLSASAAIVPLAAGGKVHWDAAGLMATGAVAGAYLGARLFSRISTIWVARAFVALIVAAAVRMALQSAEAAVAETAAVAIDPLISVGLAATGFFAGILASMALGGGTLFVVALAILFSFPQHEAQATALVVTVTSTLVAAVVYGRAGMIDWRLAGTLAVGGVLGGLLGGVMVLGVGEMLLRRMFAGLLVVTAIRMLWVNRRRSEADAVRRPAGA
jgi:uncharacterized membrane protein YfcA